MSFETVNALTNEADIPASVSMNVVAVPASLGFGSPGNEGEVAFDGDYMYVYSSINGWSQSLRTI
jgi:hypothetical protein